jgi:alpha-mannosidase
MPTLHLISHTHWDREWYLTFQQFRLKLVHLVDGLLDILDHDKDFKYFMLDGQTIVLDDYLLMRPERETDLRRYIKNGRILIGPWHILPDEFLVSPEATIRNLLLGERTTRKFGLKMMVGYIPDPFGHIGQMPQILRGFGIETSCLMRGLADEPCEFWWEAPDGSRLFMAYLRNGYGNTAMLTAAEPERFTNQIREARDDLAPYSAADHLLLMYGTDHMEPPRETSQAIAFSKGKLDGDVLIHSTLPEYLAAVQSSIVNRQSEIPTVTGELRQSKRTPMLPGVLSARMWIKQRNRACETLLEKWAEPFSTWQELVSASALHSSPPNQQSSTLAAHASAGVINRKSEILRQTWRLLMENHPHDSICGCSIDQVHDEMKVRFDQVDQIGEEITKQSLETLATSINTQSSIRNRQSEIVNPQSAIVVFNPIAGPHTDLVTVHAESKGSFEIVDEQGQAVPFQLLGSSSQDLINMVMSKKDLRSGLASIHEGSILGKVIQNLHIHKEGSQVNMEVTLADSGRLDPTSWEKGMRSIEALLDDPSVATFHVRAHSVPAAEFLLAAKDVPGHGYKTFWLRQLPSHPAKPIEIGTLARILMPVVRLAARLPFLARLLDRPKTAKTPYIIENEFLRVEASPQDGTLTVQDKQTGATYRGLNRFVDGGDRGDEYNYAPPPSDFQPVARLKRVSMHPGAVRQTLEVHLELEAPAALAPDRNSRSKQTVAIPITYQASLITGVPRVDIHTELENRARDHRLRVHFPLPESDNSSQFPQPESDNSSHFSQPESNDSSRRDSVGSDVTADYDGHFEVVRRPIGVPVSDESWVEQPRPEVPQRAFTDVSDGKFGLMIANRGLPEVEVIGVRSLPTSHTEIALTLLRCINWISRDDFEERKGHAGPMSPTPGAQMIGQWTFDYSIIPHAVGQNSISSSVGRESFPPSVGRDSFPPSVGRDSFPPTPYQQAYAFEAPLRAISTGLHEGVLPSSGSFVEVSPQEFVISAVKEAEDGSGWLVRGYNISNEEIRVTIKPWRKFNHAARLNLAEERQSVLIPNQDGHVEFTVRAHEIVTTMLKD